MWAWRDPDLWGYYGEPGVSEAERDRRRADLAGYGVEALDGSIGSVDKASYDTDNSWLVDDRHKEQIKNSPSYDPDTFDDPEYRERMAHYYDESYRQVG